MQRRTCLPPVCKRRFDCTPDQSLAAASYLSKIPVAGQVLASLGRIIPNAVPAALQQRQPGSQHSFCQEKGGMGNEVTVSRARSPREVPLSSQHHGNHGGEGGWMMHRVSFTLLLPRFFLFSFLEFLCLRSVRHKKAIPDLCKNILFTALFVPHHTLGEPHAESLWHRHVYTLYLHTHGHTDTQRNLFRQNRRENDSSLFTVQETTQKWLETEKGWELGERKGGEEYQPSR